MKTLSRCYFCRCGEKFTHRNDLRDHIKEDHNNGKRVSIAKKPGPDGRKKPGPSNKASLT